MTRRELRRLGELRPNLPLDLEHLAEEVADLGQEQRNALRSWAVQIMTRLLFLQYSPATDPRAGWADEVDQMRAEFEDRLSPTLRRDLQRSRARLYRRARREAERRLRRYGEAAAAETLPETCPFTLDQVLGDWWPQEETS